MSPRMSSRSIRRIGSTPLGANYTQTDPSDTTMVARYTAEGELDTSFGTDGYVTGPSGQGPGGTVTVIPMVVSSSGEDIYFVTDARFGAGQLTLTHATAAGVHTGFGAGGSVAVVPPAAIDGQTVGNPELVEFGAALQSDGKVVLGAVDNPPRNFYLTRLLPSGDPDLSYGSSGWTVQSLQLPSQGVGTTAYTPLTLSRMSTNDVVVVELLEYTLDDQTQRSAYVCRFLH